MKRKLLTISIFAVPITFLLVVWIGGSITKLFIAGAEDQHTTLEESRQMFSAAAAPKELWIVERARHVDLHAERKEEYEERVLSFFKRHLECQGCLSQKTSTTTNAPTGWQKINASGVFTFCLPKSAWDTGFTGIDESYKEYRVGKLRFMFVYDPMGILSYDRREQEFGKGYQEQVVEIAGRKAYLFTYVQNIRGRKRYYTDLYFGDLPNGKVELWMQADSWRRNDLEIVKRIFGTLEFLQAEGKPNKAFNQHLVSMGQPCAQK